MKQLRNTVFAGLSGAVVLMAFANNLHDLANRWWPGRVETTQSSPTQANAAQAPSASSPLDLLAPLQALTQSQTLYVAPATDAPPEGTQAQPFHTLAQALERVTTLQASQPNAPITIQLAAGIYGDVGNAPLIIPAGVTVLGQGNTTQLQQSLQLSQASRIEKVNFTDAGVLIRPESGATGEVFVQGLGMTRGFLTVQAPGPLPAPKIKIEQVEMADSCLLVSGLAQPEIKNVRLQGNVGVDEFSLTHCSDHGLLASGNRMPLIQLLGAAHLENIELRDTTLGLVNQSEGSVIKNLKIINSLSGIDNSGDLRVEGLNLNNVEYTGICNSGQISLHQASFSAPEATTQSQCPIPGLDQPPAQPIDIAGHIESVVIN